MESGSGNGCPGVIHIGSRKINTKQALRYKRAVYVMTVYRLRPSQTILCAAAVVRCTIRIPWVHRFTFCS